VTVESLNSDHHQNKVLEGWPYMMYIVYIFFIFNDGARNAIAWDQGE
jgi:hypothetical protein